MIAGAIPGTRTLAVSIYTFAETGRDREAVVLMAVSAVIAFAALYLSNRIATTPARTDRAPGRA
jgi:molybdate transport system permease protein